MWADELVAVGCCSVQLVMAEVLLLRRRPREEHWCVDDITIDPGCCYHLWCYLSQAIMTLKGMRKADQQMILDTLGMGATTTTATTTAPVGVPVATGLDSGPLGLTNTRLVFTTIFCDTDMHKYVECVHFAQYNPWVLQQRRSMCDYCFATHQQVYSHPFARQLTSSPSPRVLCLACSTSTCHTEKSRRKWRTACAQ